MVKIRTELVPLLAPLSSSDGEKHAEYRPRPSSGRPRSSFRRFCRIPAIWFPAMLRETAVCLTVLWGSASLSDDELAIVMDAAAPIQPRDRDAFLRDVASELSKYPELGQALSAASQPRSSDSI
jgi:hypothetical protein